MKKKKEQQWAVLRKGGYHPIFVAYSKAEAERFIEGHEDVLFVAEVIE